MVEWRAYGLLFMLLASLYTARTYRPYCKRSVYDGNQDLNTQDLRELPDSVAAAAFFLMAIQFLNVYILPDIVYLTQQ